MKLGTLLRISDISEADKRFAALHDMGFRSCQLVFKPERYTEQDAVIIKSAAQKYDVEISAQFCGFYDKATVWDNYEGFRTSGLNIPQYRDSRMAYIKDAAVFARNAGIPDVIIHGGYVPNNPFDKEYAELLSLIQEYCAFCKEIGINVLLETGGESPVVLLRLILDSKADNLYVNMDPANMLMYGFANPIDALYTMGKYVRNFHGKDGVPPTDPYVLGEERRIGDGHVDFRAVFTKLKELGYDRYLTIEREIEGDKQIADIVHAKAYFEKLLTELDIKVE